MTITNPTLFTLSAPNGRALAEIYGSVRDLKRFLNPANPNAATVNGTFAHDGRGNHFKVSRKVNYRP